MSDAMIRGIQLATQHAGLVPEDVRSEPEAAVALRGVPIGLLHTIGAWDRDALDRDAEIVTRLSHGGESAVRLTAQVASATAIAARTEQGEDHSRAVPVPENEEPLAQQIASIVEEVRTAESFEGAVLPVVRAGGAASALGAIAGGIAGAKFGASGIPQHLIDDLDARIYLSMAAPWYYRTVMRRAGTVIDLREVRDE